MHPFLALKQSSNAPLEAPKSALIQPYKKPPNASSFCNKNITKTRTTMTTTKTIRRGGER
jgi:hypothetical protein